MNVFKIAGMVSFFSVSCCLYTMDNYQCPLSEIEKQLVLREITTRGKDFVLEQISKEQPQQGALYDEERDLFCTNIPIILEIKTVLLEEDVSKNVLAKTIFEKIKDIEKDLGYLPELKLVQKNGCMEGIKPTNWLGSSTRYCHMKALTRQEFLETKGMPNELRFQKGRPGVEVHSRFVEKEPLLEIVKNYKS